ncbi:MAG: NADH-quinone oxidoreductase subunit M [Phototrophicaceae bacterium]
MDIFGIDILTFLILAPAFGALVVAALPSNKWLARWTALGIGIAIFAVTAVVFIDYMNVAEELAGGFHLEASYRWFSVLGASWHVGIDGISASMMLLTALLTPLAILISWEVDDRPNMHLALLLLFETGSMGVFLSMDLMVFFLFYELSLVPMYFLINQWGSPAQKGVKYTGRLYASTKFMLYSIGGTLGMLLATQLIGFTTGTYEIAEIASATGAWLSASGMDEAFLGVNVGTVKALAFFGFFVAFAIKVPIWPFHTWLPDAHGEAPTAGSMLLAGVMLKLGAYGFLRLVVPFFPDVWISNIPFFSVSWATAFAFLSMLGIVLGAFAAFGQNDIKRLVAYSSVNHMGFVGIGIAAFALLYGEAWAASQSAIAPDKMMDAVAALNGTVMQMFNHGLSSAGMFLLAGGIYHKTHTRDLTQYGGFWVKAPIFGGLFVFMSMSSLGLPGLNGFVGEFLIVRGTWTTFTWLTALSMIGLLFTGSYILKGIRYTLHGEFNLRWKDYNLEVDWREFTAVFVLGIFIFWTGLAPNWILETINSSVTSILMNIAG